MRAAPQTSEAALPRVSPRSAAPQTSEAALPRVSPRSAAGILALLLLAAWAAGATLGLERRYHESLADLQAGRYHRAMEGFMDVILEDPGYPEARERLGEAGRLLLEKESREIAAEREGILRSMRDLGQGLDGLSRRKETARRAWESRLLEAVSLARNAGLLALALERYEDSLHLFQVYTGEIERFVRGREEFEQALLSAHPEVESVVEEARSRGEDTGALIEELLRRTRRAEEWIPLGGMSVAKLPEVGPKPEEHAQRIAELERSKLRALREADESLAQYKRGRYRDSERGWRAVLETEPENGEAAFFLARAGRLAAVDDAGFVPVRSAPVRRAPAPGVRRTRPAARPAAPKTSEAALPRDNPRSAAPKTSEAALPRDNPRSAAKAAPAPEVRTPEDAARAEEAYQRGLKAYSVRDLDEAVARWEECLRLAPDHPKARKALRRAANERP